MKHPLIIAAILASSMAMAQQPQQYTVGQPGLQNLPANTPVMPAHAAQKRRNIPVKNLDLSQGSARVSGSVRGLKVAVYRFHGQAGQTVHITRNQSTRQIDAGIFRPDDGKRFADGQVLPQSGEYELRIVNIRKDAARNKKPRRYDITFSLQGSGNPATDTPVQTGPADIYSRHGHISGGPTHYRYAHPHGNMRQDQRSATMHARPQSGHQHYGGAGYHAQGVPSAAEAGVRPIQLKGQ